MDDIPILMVADNFVAGLLEENTIFFLSFFLSFFQLLFFKVNCGGWFSVTEIQNNLKQKPCRLSDHLSLSLSRFVLIIDCARTV